MAGLTSPPEGHSRWQVEHFRQNINKNYQAAIAYYTQREVNLYRVLIKKEKELKRKATKKEIAEVKAFEKGIINTMANQVNDEFDKKAQQIVEGTVTTDKGKNFIEKKELTFRQLSYKDLQILANHLNVGTNTLLGQFKNKGKGRYNTEQRVYSLMGSLKEDMIPSLVDDFLINQATNFSKKVVNSLEDAIVKNASKLGNVKTTTESLSRNSSKSLGIDYGSNDVFSNPDKTEISANIYCDAAADVFYNNFEGGSINFLKQRETSLQNFLNQYLTDPNLVKSWGIQIKKFNSGDKVPTIKYRDYTKLKDAINKKYESGDPIQRKEVPKVFTWNATQAYYYMLSKVSDNLIAALGPTTAGVLFGDTFYSMSNFVANHVFRFSVMGAKSTEVTEREGEKGAFDLEIHPQIFNSNLQASKSEGQKAFLNYKNYGVIRALERGANKEKEEEEDEESNKEARYTLYFGQEGKDPIPG